MTTRTAVVAGLVGLLVAAMAGAAAAHPLGGFTTNTHLAVTVGVDATRISYVRDLAEIPALQAVQRLDTDDDGRLTDVEAASEESRGCDEIADAVTVTVDGDAVDVTAGVGSLTQPPGQAGLTTMRLECPLHVATGPIRGRTAIAIADGNGADRAGWRELTAVADGVTIERRDVPAASVSDALRAYPADRLQAPLDVRTAHLVVRAGGGAPRAAAALGGAPPAVDRLAAAFTRLVRERAATPGVTLLALGLAVVLGALHGLAPGHGKTIMAAYVVGQRGTVRQVLGVGLTVAATHTAGVLALALVVATSATLAPERLYPWMGAASGLVVTAVGLRLLVRAGRRRRGRPHVHALPGSDDTLRRRDHVAIGLAGGLVPSPSAVVVLLGASALGRAVLGVGLVVAYGVGLALALVGAGLALVRVRGVLQRWADRGGARPALLGTVVPVVAAAVVVVAGVLLVTRSLLV